jgi:hypothetical protein
MSLMSKLGVEHKGLFVFALFYLVAAAANFIILGLYGLGLFHVGIVAVLSLAAALGLYSLRRWSLWLVVGLFFVTTTYGVVMLSTSLRNYASGLELGAVFGVVAWVVYLVLTWVATVYVAARRKDLK